jgi:hypothetical protein
MFLGEVKIATENVVIVLKNGNIEISQNPKRYELK